MVRNPRGLGTDPNHTAAFWNEVDKVLPDYRERKEWLRVNGAGMDLYQGTRCTGTRR